MTFLLFYAAAALLFALFGLIWFDSPYSYPSDRKFGAQLLLAAPVWPLVVAVLLIVGLVWGVPKLPKAAYKGAKTIWKEAWR